MYTATWVQCPVYIQFLSDVDDIVYIQWYNRQINLLFLFIVSSPESFLWETAFQGAGHDSLLPRYSQVTAVCDLRLTSDPRLTLISCGSQPFSLTLRLVCLIVYFIYNNHKKVFTQSIYGGVGMRVIMRRENTKSYCIYSKKINFVHIFCIVSIMAKGIKTSDFMISIIYMYLKIIIVILFPCS